MPNKHKERPMDTAVNTVFHDVSLLASIIMIQVFAGAIESGNTLVVVVAGMGAYFFIQLNVGTYRYALAEYKRLRDNAPTEGGDE